MIFLEITLSYKALMIIGTFSTLSSLVLIFFSVKHLINKKKRKTSNL
ncbi:hypothetical protein SAMN05216503_2253 [Polaribacter sp. KT25b]|nr:hypothetical protein SAMN05216503_2253 [Polaribacter sp. KT25b]